jgi:anti-anti-sigma factor
MQADQFSITDAEIGGLVGVAVVGELDGATCDRQAAALDEATNSDGGGPVLLDLEECTFVDSMGLAVIAAAAMRLDKEGRKLVVAKARGQNPAPAGPIWPCVLGGSGRRRRPARGWQRRRTLTAASVGESPRSDPAAKPKAQRQRAAASQSLPLNRASEETRLRAGHTAQKCRERGSGSSGRCHAARSACGAPLVSVSSFGVSEF